ncbi:MAG: hypothetical protein KGN78_02015 [Actinomycetales bacterium]|nr:hypothetical protein [Actinomycetales bacterium]
MNIRVVHGSPTPEELAVVIALLTSAGPRATAKPATGPLNLWSRRSRMIRPPQRPGPDAWRASMLPR